MGSQVGLRSAERPFPQIPEAWTSPSRRGTSAFKIRGFLGQDCIRSSVTSVAFSRPRSHKPVARSRRQSWSTLNSSSSSAAAGLRFAARILRGRLLSISSPTRPAGQEVQRATLSLRIGAVGDVSTLRLNGKPPVAVSVLSCLPNSAICTLVATWDFRGRHSEPWRCYPKAWRAVYGRTT